jgi:hypothetical protein
MIVFNEAMLCRHRKLFLEYYPESAGTYRWRKIRRRAGWCSRQELGRVVAVLQVGGLHHRYERRTA